MASNYIASRSKAGFTLLWVSILLTVAALVFVSILPGQDAGDYNQKELATVKKLEYVENAMRAFMAFNGRRPCPADGQYGVNTANFGKEAGTPGTCTGNTAPTPNAPMGPDAGTGFVVGGVIPTKSLNIPDDFAFDGWGRRFTYVVDKRATEAGTCDALQNYPTNNGVGGIRIESSTGVTPELDDVMYAYISHGGDGHGAFPEQGSTVANRINIGSTDQDENTNAGASNDGNMTYSTGNFTNVFVQKDKTSTFDHIVWYRSDLKNTCCLGAFMCSVKGFRVDGYFHLTGYGVAVGDVNGDGIPDLIIGEITSDYIYVVFGTKTGFPDPLPVTSLNGTNGFSLYEPGANENAGAVVAAGDINKDGYADIIIGAASNYLSSPGYTYVVYGKKDWSAHATYSLDNVSATHGVIDGIQGFRLDGVTASDALGTAVATGDINGDGYADIIIGAYGANSYAGYTYVVFGGASILPSTTVTTTNGSKAITPASYTGLMVGQTLTASGIAAGTKIHDCNGGVNTVGTPCTASINLSGNATGASTTLNVATTPLNAGYGTLIDGTKGIRLDGVTANDWTGSALATGDVNKDGYADIIIGAPPSNNVKVGHTYGVFGGTSPILPTPTVITSNASATATVSSYTGLMVGQTLSSLNILPGTTITACGGGTVCTSNTLTLSANATGGDGITPVAMTVATTPLNTGAGTWIDGTHGFRLDGVTNNDHSGVSVATGDVNGDGYADIIIDSYGTQSVYVVFGNSGAWPATQTLATGAGNLIDGTKGFRLWDSSVTYFGMPTVATGDVNGDGYSDIIIPAADGSWYGYTYVVFGKSGAWPATQTVAMGAGNLIDGIQGFRLDGPYCYSYGNLVAVGDLNGDGYADIINGYPNGNSGNGYTYVFFGHKTTATNPWPNPNWGLSGL